MLYFLLKLSLVFNFFSDFYSHAQLLPTEEGLQTPEGFSYPWLRPIEQISVKPKTLNVAGKRFESNQRTGASSKPSQEMLEHDRKRQIELKLVVLEDKLIDHGYTEANITERLADARRDLESAAAAAVGAEAE